VSFTLREILRTRSGIKKVEWWEVLNYDPQIYEIILEAEKKAAEQHHNFHAVSMYNQAKVLRAFQELKISDDCFNSSEGYGYNDFGREKLEALFAHVFKGEDAIVRPHLVSGTHTIFTCLRGLLRPGDRLLSVTGQPYDTLSRSICGNYPVTDEGSLLDWNISFGNLNLEDFEKPADMTNFEKMLQKPTKVVFIQRSRGYDPDRPSLTIEKLASLISTIRNYNNEVTIFVDNCYGEFVERREPLEVGADVIAGSLIKNPGGGLAPTGGYIVGKTKDIKQISHSITAPGLGKELGAFVYNKRLFFQGLFMAPHLTCEALKGGATTAAAFESMGYKVQPRFNEQRGDIVQVVCLKNKEELQKICQAVQSSSPINSHILPVAGYTAGYKDPIYMAAGTFVQGASSEFSADAPEREPFSVFIQGGLSYQHIIIGLAGILQSVR
jgi:cystathionine beta-lyase family protein involved in aluminum resistance